MFLLEFIESILKCTPGAFASIALAPKRGPQNPANLETGPTFRIQKADPPGELARGFFLYGKMTITE